MRVEGIYPLAVVALLASTLLSAALTLAIRKHALRVGMMDVPNSRSSHVAPTPRGGGLAIVLVCLGASWALAAAGLVDMKTMLAVTLPAMLVAAVGYIDDRLSLSASSRFIAHLVGALVSVVMVWASAPASAEHTASLWLVSGVLVLGVCWSTNLFNFMDGIDGIAASQSIFMAVSAALLARPGAGEGIALMLLATAGASLGFLVWNWPPAKIFMGDVGSGFLGFWLAVNALALHAVGALSVWTSLILGSVFIADATVTLFRRMLRGAKWYEAHRSHAYQRLARRWNSHRKVTALVWAINLVIVLPCAFASLLWPSAAAWIAGLLTLALVLGCVAAGAGSDGSVGSPSAGN